MLESLLFTVTPPSSSSIPQLTFVSTIEGVPTSGGALDLAPAGAHVTGSLSLPTGVTCYPSFINDDPDNPTLRAPDLKTLPIDISLSLHERGLGLPQQLYFDTAKTIGKLSKQGAFTFDLTVPVGHYDIYVAPPANQEPGCAIPPQIWRDYPIDAVVANLELTAAPVVDIGLTIHWPGGAGAGDLTGWVADIIEPIGGNRISTLVTLGAPVGASASVEYDVPLRYSPSSGASDATADAGMGLLRLRPPASLIAPSIYLDLSALGLFDIEHPDVTRFTHFPKAVNVHGLLTRLDTGKPVAGNLLLFSSSISGIEPGIFGSYRTTLEVGSNGMFELELPPGTYNVQAVPLTDTGSSSELPAALASLRATWQIAETPSEQFGRILELPVSAQLTGQSQMQGARVQADPTPELVTIYKEVFGGAQEQDSDHPNDLLDPGVFAPRAASALVDASGRFAVRADPGRFNVSVGGPEALGFAWFVRPGIDVADRDVDLGRIVLPRPTLLSGVCSVSLPDGTVVPAPAATIRAYAYLDKDFTYTRDPAEAQSLIQVGETHADKAGAYRLLVPPSLAPAR